MKNFEKMLAKFNNMRLDNMAEFLSNHIGCYEYCSNRKMYCKGCKCGKEKCIEYVKQWLESEAE